MIAIIGIALQIALLLLKKWFSWDAERKAEAKEILKEGVKDAKSATLMFDRINAL